MRRWWSASAKRRADVQRFKPAFAQKWTKKRGAHVSEKQSAEHKREHESGSNKRPGGHHSSSWRWVKTGRTIMGEYIRIQTRCQ